MNKLLLNSSFPFSSLSFACLSPFLQPVGSEPGQIQFQMRSRSSFLELMEPLWEPLTEANSIR